MSLLEHLYRSLSQPEFVTSRLGHFFMRIPFDRKILLTLRLI